MPSPLEEKEAVSPASETVARQDALDLASIRQRCEAERMPPGGPSAAFEAMAERFHADTGLLAPGKDAGTVPWDCEEREAEWRRWLAHDRSRRHEEAIADRATLLAEVERLRASQAQLREALDLLRRDYGAMQMTWRAP